MAIEFHLPELGENIDSGDLIRILVAEGDRIEKDQAVLELETDKATIEVPSPVSGTVKQIHVREGTKIKVGQLIFTVEDGVGAPSAETPASAESGSAVPEPPVAAPVPEAEPRASSSAPAAGAQQGEPAAPAEETSWPTPQREETDRTGAVIRMPFRPTEDKRVLVPAAPSVRRLAREIGVDIAEVSGSGPGGRITMEDVKAHAKALLAGRSRTGTPAAPVVEPLPDFARWGAIERQPMSNVRRKTAEHLTYAWRSIPHVTQHDRADITDTEELRKQLNGRAQARAGKITLTAIALKIVAAALKEFPQFATSVDMARQEIIYKKYVHIGVAVDTPRGLLVPVVRNVDRKNVFEVAVELAELAEKARQRKLSREEISGGVFSITNLGGIGGTLFTPIVNAPEVAILGMSRANWEPVHIAGQFIPRLVLPLSLSYDHRVIDGADAARFLRWVAQAFEKPAPYLE
ncbi:MAG: 2-oxo acid dehydrogenase subunit E2 [Firmicutes bacterium]|nr:2-oxo acid dehydrogenase subunit E2 [Bacillota bacterium]